MMLSDACAPVAIGLLLGIGGAMLSTRAIATFLFQTTPTDAGTFAAVVGVLAMTACLAAWIPARRAARVDPVTALRAE
jgi:putative ABC transport system permease protein